MHFIKTDLKFGMSQHTFSKVTIKRWKAIYIQNKNSNLGKTKNSSDPLIKWQHLTGEVSIQSWVQFLHKQGFLIITMLVGFPQCEDFKIIPFNIMTSSHNMIGNSWCVLMFGECFTMFSFSIHQSSLCFAKVEITAVPTTCFVNNPWPLGTI